MANFINGTVPTGELISNHMDIDKVFFTGSVRAGKAIAQACAASNLKSTCLELGGKSPHIIFPDCDLDAAAENVLSGFAGFMVRAQCLMTPDISSVVNEIVGMPGWTAGNPVRAASSSQPS